MVVLIVPDCSKDSEEIGTHFPAEGEYVYGVHERVVSLTPNLDDAKDFLTVENAEKFLDEIRSMSPPPLVIMEL